MTVTGKFARAARDRSPAGRLVDLGLVDRAFYEAQVNERFPDELAAARHAVRFAATLGCSFHPLVEPDYLPARWTEPWKQHGRFGPFLRRLTSRELRQDTSPLFHPPAWIDLHPDAVEHPGGPLAHFIGTAGADTQLPRPPTALGVPLRWGDVREEALRRAADYGRQVARGGPRTTNGWTAADHLDWLRTWAAAAVPRFDGRPAVSVVLVVDDGRDSAAAAVRSILGQTHRDWELLVVYDGPADPAPEVLRVLGDENPRIRMLPPQSGGVGAARNAALHEARGHYVAFLDIDSTWEPAFLQLALAAAHGQGLRAAHAVAEISGSSPPAYVAFQGDREDLLVENHVPLITLVAEADLVRAVGGFDESFRQRLDHDLVLRLAERTPLQLLPFIGARSAHEAGSADPNPPSEAANWESAAVGKNLVDWDDEQHRLDRRVAGRVSILIPTFQDEVMTRRAVTAVLATTDHHDIEVVVIDNGSRRSVSAILWASFAGDPRVVVKRLGRNYNFSGGSNAAFAASTGEFVVFLNNDTLVRHGWLHPLIEPLDDPDVLGTQSLLVYNNGTVQSAGTVFPAEQRLPSAFLAGHAVDDARRDSGEGFSAVSAAALAMRAADVVALRGFDSRFVNGMEDVDLCLRARSRNPSGFFRVIPDSVVTHFESKTHGRWARASASRRLFMDRWRGRLPASHDDLERYRRLGFEVVAIAADPAKLPAPRPVLRRPAAAALAKTAADLPGQMRWTLNIASTAGGSGHMWGDTHFAASLGRALRALGQETVTFHRGAHDSPASHLTDVALTLRGLDRTRVQPGALNILWVISHPDLVPADELKEFDLVLAASQRWAASVEGRLGRPVHVLHQATDPAVFSPRVDNEQATSVLFIGSTRGGSERPIVRDAIEAGLDLAVYGPGWQGRLPPGVWRGEYVANDRLCEAYGGAGIVLNDHWADMAEHGFVNNRLYDAVASGARVVSDAVPGLDEMFGGAVRTYTSVEELRFLCGAAGRAAFPDAAERTAIAEAVRREHSFDARAHHLQVLARDALAARIGR